MSDSAHDAVPATPAVEDLDLPVEHASEVQGGKGHCGDGSPAKPKPGKHAKPGRKDPLDVKQQQASDALNQANSAPGNVLGLLR